jgi:hypothetical protein
VRYSVRQALGREIDALTIHVGGLRFQAGPLPASPDSPILSRADAEPGESAPADSLADSPADRSTPRPAPGSDAA